MISALFVRADSVYKTIGLDCWDIDRNALLWPGGNPAIFHPPCRGWGRMRWFSKADEEEKMLAVWAVDQVRKWGGVLEQPGSSSLWSYCSLPQSGIDNFGGFTMSVNLNWFGFPAEKRTWLYIVGCGLKDIPPHPLSFDCITRTVFASRSRHKSGKKELNKSMRDKTPVAMAYWLYDICLIVQSKQNDSSRLSFSTIR